MSDKVSEKMKKAKGLPEPEELFNDQRIFEDGKSENSSEEHQEYVRRKNIYIPQYRMIERKYGGWFLVCIIVFLIFAIFKLSHIQLYCMQSESMQSILPKGSLVIVKSVDPEEIQIDDVITFVSSGGIIVTHQVAAIETDVDGNVAFRTKGSENDLMDRDIVTIGQLKGKMIKGIPKIGKLFDIRSWFGN